MTVILGHKHNNIIRLGADKMVVNADDSAQEDHDKIVVINNHLAVACAGSMSVQKMIELEVNKSTGRTDIYGEDILEFLHDFYKKANEMNLESIINQESCFIIAGLNRKKELAVMIISYIRGKFEYSDNVEAALFPPADLTLGKCLEIYKSNFQKYPQDYFVKTITDISKISKYVNSKGTLWEYDMNSDRSNKEEFNRE